MLGLLYMIFVGFMLCFIFMRVRDVEIGLMQELGRLREEVAALRTELEKQKTDKER